MVSLTSCTRTGFMPLSDAKDGNGTQPWRARAVTLSLVFAFAGMLTVP